MSSLLQDFGSTGPSYDADKQYKRVDYGYDLVSGKVNSVSYQAGKPDAFMHFYRYDAENRLGDYQPINGTTLLTDLKAKLGASYKGLYNGNISSMAVNIGILNNPKLYNYQYDQLNRLTGMNMLNGTNTGLNLWTNNLTPSNDYTEKGSYDPNGNILTYIRHGYGTTPAMDSMTYHYVTPEDDLPAIRLFH